MFEKRKKYYEEKINHSYAKAKPVRNDINKLNNKIIRSMQEMFFERDNNLVTKPENITYCFN